MYVMETDVKSHSTYACGAAHGDRRAEGGHGTERAWIQTQGMSDISSGCREDLNESHRDIRGDRPETPAPLDVETMRTSDPWVSEWNLPFPFF